MIDPYVPPKFRTPSPRFTIPSRVLYCYSTFAFGFLVLAWLYLPYLRANDVLLGALLIAAFASGASRVLMGNRMVLPSLMGIVAAAVWVRHPYQWYDLLAQSTSLYRVHHLVFDTGLLALPIETLVFTFITRHFSLLSVEKSER